MSTWEYVEAQPAPINRATSWFGILETEKSLFVTVNLMDIFMTSMLLQTGAFYESNPIAGYVVGTWGLMGMAVFKLILVAFVLMICNIIAFKRLRTAKLLLQFGTAIVGSVVIYSLFLLMTLRGL